MNIALFADSYKPYISGVAVSVETLSLALRKKGHTTYVFAPSYAVRAEKRERPTGP